MLRFLAHLRSAARQALADDVFNTAKAAAYSGMLMLFPALLVATTLLARVPQGSTLIGTIRVAFKQVMPVDTLAMLQPYVLSSSFHSTQVMLSACGVGVFAGLGMMLSLMEGFSALPVRL
jgi:membrane protein